MRVYSYKTSHQSLHFVDHFRGRVRFIGRKKEARLTTITFDDKVKGRTVSVDFPDDLMDDLFKAYNSRDDIQDVAYPLPNEQTVRKQERRDEAGIIDIPRFLNSRKG